MPLDKEMYQIHQDRLMSDVDEAKHELQNTQHSLKVQELLQTTYELNKTYAESAVKPKKLFDTDSSIDSLEKLIYENHHLALKVENIAQDKYNKDLAQLQ